MIFRLPASAGGDGPRVAADGAEPRAARTRRQPRPWGTEELLPAARRYREWITSQVSTYLGDDPLIVAAGAGEYARAWAEQGTRVTVSEEEPALVEALRERFADWPQVNVRQVGLEELAASGSCEPDRYSAVVALNVLEHVPDDVAVLLGLVRLVRPGGAVAVMTPAFGTAMSAFDRDIGHLRRYRLRDMVLLAGRAGLPVQEVRYFNSLGLLAWICGVRIARLTPKAGPMVKMWDMLAIPLLRALERRWLPPFGKEILLVARVPQQLSG